MKKFISVLLLISLLLTFVSCSDGKEKEEETTGSDSSAFTAADIALSSENFSFTRAEVSYMFWQSYAEFKSEYSESVDMYNIDTGASLKDQVYHDDITWFSFIADGVIEEMTITLALCEKAKAVGLELDDEDKKTIDETVATWTSYAESYDYKIESLLGKYFNSDVTVDTIRSYMEKDILASKYRYQMTSEYSFGDEDIEKYVEDNPADFYRIDYLSYTFDEDDIATPKAKAEELAKSESADAFKASVKEYMMTTLEMGEENSDEELEGLYTEGELRKTYSDYSTWAFDGAKAGEGYVDADEVNGEYTVYYLTKAPYLDEHKVKSIRTIEESISRHSGNTATIDYLNELLDEWKKGEATEESFAQIDEDDGSFSNVSYFDEYACESIKNWLYNEERTAGDTAVLKGEDSDNVYYAVYYVGEENEGWKYYAVNNLAQDKLESDYEALQKEFPVEVSKDVVYSLEG